MRDILENVLSCLEKVRERQPGQWSARCPAHADKGPSLSIRMGDSGAILLYCFAGCSVESIVSALGLELSDLFPPRERPAGAPKRLAPLLTNAQIVELMLDELMFAAMLLTNFSHGVLPTAADLDRLRETVGRLNWMRDEARSRVRGTS